MTTRTGKWLAVLASTALVAVLASCGGDGGDGGDDGVVPPPPASKTVMTTGPITGFGSVHVNGVRYATADADIEIDGVKSSLAELQVGEVIDLKGVFQDGSARADVIRYHHNLEGPITAIYPDEQTFVAMGQTVIVSSETSFGDSVSPASILGLDVDDVVEVSGLIDASGVILATRVDLRLQGGGAYDVYGTASGVDAAAKVFLINALVVDYSSASIDDFPDGAPVNGDLVLATGFDFGDAGEFIATRVELRYDQEVMPGPGNTVHVEGLVTRFVSATDFDVAGWPVTTTAATVYENGTVADLALDVHVCIEGVLDTEGVLVANRVRFRMENTVRIVSTITAIGADQMQALGVTVRFNSMTSFEDRSTTGADRLEPTDLHTGEWVDIRGYEDPAGSGDVRASRVVRIDEQGAHQMRGPFRAPARPDFDILAVQVTTTDTTRFVLEGGTLVTAEEFFGLEVGTLVEARGAWSGSVLTATHAVIKTSDD